MFNSSFLREMPRTQRASVIPLKQELSLIDWLRQTGRLIKRDTQEQTFADTGEEEISEFLGGDDGIGYDDDDDGDLEAEEP
jgi:Protein of unknown function (DUF3134)